MVKTCARGKIRNAVTRKCVSKTSKIGVVVHNKKTVREDDVAKVLTAVRQLNSNDASSLIARLRALLRRHEAVTIVILAAIASGMFGFSTDTAKAVAAKLLRRGTEHSKELVEDLWSRVFKGASKKKLEEMARAAGPGKFALAFKTLWPKLLMAAAAAGSVAAMASGHGQLVEIVGSHGHKAVAFLQYGLHGAVPLSRDFAGKIVGTVVTTGAAAGLHVIRKTARIPGKMLRKYAAPAIVATGTGAMKVGWVIIKTIGAGVWDSLTE